MTEYKLENANIGICMNSLGAEMKSLVDKETGREYLWGADPRYWKRTAPVLFPLVGSLKGGRYRYGGREYFMSQHGFARDMEFELVRQSGDEIWFALEETRETLEQYPFRFRLELGYRLEGREVVASWKVRNTNDGAMYFSIGGHPAFLCPFHAGEKQTDCSILLDAKEQVSSSLIGEGGLLAPGKKVYRLRDGYLGVTPELFDGDALVIEEDQAHEASLCGGDGKPYLTVRFAAPLFGIWSPPKKEAPFICIEPWYGRCDREDFDGDLTERAWGNRLEAGDVFEAEYRIII